MITKEIFKIEKCEEGYIASCRANSKDLLGVIFAIEKAHDDLVEQLKSQIKKYGED